MKPPSRARVAEPDVMVHFTLWPSRCKNQGSLRSVPWPRLEQRFLKASKPFLGDRDHPCWSPCAFRPGTYWAPVSFSALVFLVEQKTGNEISQLQELLDVCGRLYTAPTEAKEKPRYTLVLPLERMVSRDEFTVLRNRWNARLRSFGLSVPDQSPALGDRYRLPGEVPGQRFESVRFSGPYVTIGENDE